MAAWCSS